MSVPDKTILRDLNEYSNHKFGVYYMTVPIDVNNGTF